MPRLGLTQMKPGKRAGVVVRLWQAVLPVVCAAWVAGCAGSSNSAAPVAGGLGDNGAPNYSSETAAAAPSTFAPTASAAAAAAHSGPAAEAAAKLTSAGTPGSNAYKIGPLDVLDVAVFKVPDLSKTVQVAEDGTITYPLIGQVSAAGKTAHGLEVDLKQKLGEKYLRSPQITVLVKEYNSQRVTISGAVKTTGVYAIKGRTTLVQVIAMAGDIDGSTASGDIVVFRTIDGQRSAARFEADAIKTGKADDPEVLPGDVIVVDTSATKVALSNVLRVLPLATSAAIFVPLM
jgi:polysaccharide export outer membrane protein